MQILGDMYAFGLLGAFVFSSLSLDSIRWNSGKARLGILVRSPYNRHGDGRMGSQPDRETAGDLLWRRQ